MVWEIKPIVCPSRRSSNYQRSEVIDPLTVKFYFNKPSPGFLQGTATIGSSLASLSTLQRNFEELGDARHIIGSGPCRAG